MKAGFAKSTTENFEARSNAENMLKTRKGLEGEKELGWSDAGEGVNVSANKTEAQSLTARGDHHI
jgi:hypothetical protein